MTPHYGERARCGDNREMKPRARFGEVFTAVVQSLRDNPEAAELAPELQRLADEIRALSPSQPFVEGFERAYGITDGAHYGGAPLVSLAAEMVADHAPDSGWSRSELVSYLEGLGPARAADFLEELATAVGV